MKRSLQYVFGILLLLYVPSVFIKANYISSICFFISSIFCIPYSRDAIEHLLSFKFNRIQKYVIVIVFFLLGLIFVNTAKTQDIKPIENKNNGVVNNVTVSPSLQENKQKPVIAIKQYIKGKKGGCFYINKKGKKVYVDKKFCK